MMLLHHAQVHSVSAGMIVLAKHGSILSSKGGPRKLQQQKNTKGVPEHFNLIRMGEGAKVFFVFS